MTWQNWIAYAESLFKLATSTLMISGGSSSSTDISTVRTLSHSGQFKSRENQRDRDFQKSRVMRDKLKKTA
jgi:hypothetical protein